MCPRFEEWVTSAGHFVASYENQRAEAARQPLEIAEQSCRQRLGLAEGKQVTAWQLLCR
jgi:hypothetical protein